MKHNIVIGLLVMVSLVCAGCVTDIDEGEKMYDEPTRPSLSTTPESITPESTTSKPDPTPISTQYPVVENVTENKTFILDYERGGSSSGRRYSPPIPTPIPDPQEIPEFSSIGFVIAIVGTMVLLWRRKK